MTKTKNIQKEEYGKYLVEVKNLKKWFPVQMKNLKFIKDRDSPQDQGNLKSEVIVDYQTSRK